SARRIPAVSHAPAAHKEDGLNTQSLYNPDGVDDEPNGISQGIRDAPVTSSLPAGNMSVELFCRWRLS
ncbi:MAG TPA: hypothetical protein PKA51_14485, partial [Kiritimatiellia bacterium]|nr:hypothetical protein [Kiritimatiellia bacterium]